jgi:hypothetical protein
MARPKCDTPLVFFVYFVFTKERGKEKTPQTLMPLPPFTATSCILIQTGLPFRNPRFYKEKRSAKQNKSCGFLFVFLKKQDACHVDKLAPSCLPWRDFNDLSNLVRNANAIKLVVIVRKVLTPHQNISMYKTHGNKEERKKLV